jgi:hypothetical protein
VLEEPVLLPVVLPDEVPVLLVVESDAPVEPVVLPVVLVEPVEPVPSCSSNPSCSYCGSRYAIPILITGR